MNGSTYRTRLHSRVARELGLMRQSFHPRNVEGLPSSEPLFNLPQISKGPVPSPTREQADNFKAAIKIAASQTTDHAPSVEPR
jgi:hypothetical protein